MNISHLLIIGFGGFFGSIARYVTVRTLDQRLASLFPFGTLTVNIAGSLMLGILYGVALKRYPNHEQWILFLGTGFCGGFTTFSAFSYENYSLLHQRPSISLLYIALSLSAGIFAVAVGFWVGKSIS